jgi:3-hydroxyisobutyrate dehydrogenase-like beta-hydroxyacid dehydrogenase
VAERAVVGFVGLGVMGEAMCRNVLTKSGLPVVVFDIDPAPVARLVSAGAESSRSIAELSVRSDIVLLSLPSGPHVEEVVAGEHGILTVPRPGRMIVDHSTSPVALTRHLAERAQAAGNRYCDAPVARTRAAAASGTLSIMVGGTPEDVARIEPILRCMATDITHCGDIGAGQTLKILNNMVLFENVLAISEAAAIARRCGLDVAFVFETLTKGSADSFALRNHGLKAVAPSDFPTDAFSCEYAHKDVEYAIELAAELGLPVPGAELVRDMLEQTIASGRGKEYFPAISALVDAGTQDEHRRSAR